LPPAARVALECRSGFRATRFAPPCLARGAGILQTREAGVLQKRVSHIVADFEVRPANAGAQPRGQPGRLATQRGDSRFQHAARKPTPPRMGGSDGAAIASGKEYGNAIGNKDCAHPAGGTRDGSVGAIVRRAGPIR
jgi:hypothetical protein